MKLFIKEANKEIELDPEFVAALADHIKEGQPSVLVDLDPAVHGMIRAEIPAEKIAEAKFGGQMAQSFQDELRQISMEKAAETGDLQPASGYGRGEDGAPGLKEQITGAQLDLERKAEEARQVGEPKSDQLQKVLQRIQGTSGEAEVKVRDLQTKAAALGPAGTMAGRAAKWLDQPVKKGLLKGWTRTQAGMLGATGVGAAGYGLHAAGKATAKTSAEKSKSDEKFRKALMATGVAAGAGLGSTIAGYRALPESAKKVLHAYGKGHLVGGLAGGFGGALLARHLTRKKTSQAQTIPVTREDVLAAAGKARRRGALGTMAGTAGGAALGALLKPRAAGAALGALSGMAAGRGVGGAMAGSSFRKELMRRAKARQEATKTSAERKGRALPTGVATGMGAGAIVESLRRRKELAQIPRTYGMLPTSVSKDILAKAKRGRLAGSIAAGGLAGGLLAKAIAKGRKKTSAVKAAKVGDPVKLAPGLETAGATAKHQRSLEKLTPEQRKRIGGLYTRRKRVGTALGALGGAALGGFAARSPVGVIGGGLLGGLAGRRMGEARGATRAGKELMKTLGEKTSSVQQYAEGLLKISAVTSVGYSKYFKNKMHTRGITSPTQLSDTQKREFFGDVDRGWHSSREKFQKLKGGAPLA